MRTGTAKRVLACCDWYFPGNKGGGPMHALANMAARLGKEYAFRIVTHDRDIGDASAYAGVPLGQWHRAENAEVFYMPPAGRLWALLKLVRTTDFDLLYFNSFLSPDFTFPLLLFRWMGLIKKCPIVVAPRGEFSQGALKLKRVKKRLYISAIKVLGLCRDAVWHVSSEYEAADVRRRFGPRARIFIARDCLPDTGSFDAPASPPQKIAGRLDIVFLSRIARMKNLAGALRMLSGLRGAVNMHIYGPKEDAGYWSECEEIIKSFPANIRVEYRGMVAHEAVMGVMARHHVFFLPTEGENFGFAIFEALTAGCPVLISDRTPWRNLQAAGCGWDVPIEQPGRFREVLQECVDIGQAEYSALSQRARAYGAKAVREDASVAQSLALFEAALAGPPHEG